MSYQRKIDQAAGKMFESISFSFGFDLPAFTFLSKCFFISSIYKKIAVNDYENDINIGTCRR
jgi:hypothetical protein